MFTHDFHKESLIGFLVDIEYNFLEDEVVLFCSIAMTLLLIYLYMYKVKVRATLKMYKGYDLSLYALILNKIPIEFNEAQIKEIVNRTGFDPQEIILINSTETYYEEISDITNSNTEALIEESFNGRAIVFFKTIEDKQHVERRFTKKYNPFYFMQDLKINKDMGNCVLEECPEEIDIIWKNFKAKKEIRSNKRLIIIFLLYTLANISVLGIYFILNRIAVEQIII